MAEIAQHVRALREGDEKAKAFAALALRNLAFNSDANRVRIVEAGGVPLLVDLLRDGRARAKWEAARTLQNLAYNNGANRIAIAEAGGIPPLIELLRNGSSANAKVMAAWVLSILASNNDANAVAIAVTVGSLEALVELARRGSVTVDNLSAVFGAGVPAKRKAALVVAALLRDFVPKSVPREIKGLIGPCL